MRFKSWPYYEEWKEIFGKDRATGEAAEDFVDAWNELKDQDTPVDDFSHMSVDETEGPHEEEGDSGSEANKAPPAKQPPAKKRKDNEEMRTICDVLDKIGNKADARLAELVKRIGYEFDLGKARGEAFVKLGDIPGLSIDQRFDVCEMLGKEVSQLQIFMGLPDDARPLYVSRLLSKSAN